MTTRPTHHDLSRRERQIVDILYARGKATAAEVQAALPDPPSYSAVRAMLRILEEKGHVKHEQDGPRYVTFQRLGATTPSARRCTTSSRLFSTARRNRRFPRCWTTGIQAVGCRTRPARPPDRPGSQHGSAMMRLNDFFLSPAAGPWLALADAILKATILFAAAGLASVLLRKATAAARHLVWSLALVSAMALPVLSFALPRWQVRVVTVTPLTTVAAVPQEQPADAPATANRSGPVSHLAARVAHAGTPPAGTARRPRCLRLRHQNKSRRSSP